MKKEWQPIETAPKDGTYFLGFDKFKTIGVFHYIEWCIEGKKYWNYEDREEWSYILTHWMPLPEPPEDQN
jgi:hypothetical protein